MKDEKFINSKKIFFAILSFMALNIGLWFNNTLTINAAIFPIPDVCSNNLLQTQNELTCLYNGGGFPPLQCSVHAECCASCESDTAVCVISEPSRNEGTQGAYTDNEGDTSGGYQSSCTDSTTGNWAYCQRTSSGSCPSGYSASSYEGYNCGIYKEKDVDSIYQAQGKWNASQNECITCSGKIKNKVCATTGSFFIDGSGECNGSGDATLQKSCDATVSDACDDRTVGDACSPPASGTCDANGQCVAAVTPTPTGSPTPTPTSGACNQLSCGGIVSNQPCMCGLQLVSVNGNYCCAADNFYGNLTDCQAADLSCATPTTTPTTSPTGSPTASPTTNPTGSPTIAPTGSPAPAGNCDPNSSLYCNPLLGTVNNIVQAGQKIIAYTLGLIGSIALLVIIISGLMYITSAGNEQKIETAKKMLTSAAIGLAIAVLAYGFLQVIIAVLNTP